MSVLSGPEFLQPVDFALKGRALPLPPEPLYCVGASGGRGGPFARRAYLKDHSEIVDSAHRQVYVRLFGPPL